MHRFQPVVIPLMKCANYSATPAGVAAVAQGSAIDGCDLETLDELPILPTRNVPFGSVNVPLTVLNMASFSTVEVTVPASLFGSARKITFRLV